MVGGGGAGGNFRYRGGGGGAGAYKTGTTPIGSHPVSTVIQVGAGGVGNAMEAPSSAGNGTPSYFGTPITSPGGGQWRNGPPRWNILVLLVDLVVEVVVSGVSTAGTGSGDPFPGTIGATPKNGWGSDGGAGSGNPIGAGGGGAGWCWSDSGATGSPNR